MLAVGLVRDAGPPRLSLSPVGFDRLAGWGQDDQAAALPALLKSCAHLARQPEEAAFGPVDSGVDYGRVKDWLPVCRDAAAVPANDATAARRFFESDFVPLAVADYGDSDGLFTGYFEIELNGSRRRHGTYQTPIYRRPPDLGKAPRLSRAAIEDGALAGHGLVLFWVDDPVDAFFLQIQGSGRVRLEDGEVVRVGYDGQNGLSYVPVGRLLIERGVIPREKLTMASIEAWMHAHPAAGAAMRREDPSYVFFRVVKGDGPLGAEQVALTPERSLRGRPRLRSARRAGLARRRRAVYPGLERAPACRRPGHGRGDQGPGARRSVLGRRRCRRRPRRRDERAWPRLPAAAPRSRRSPRHRRSAPLNSILNYRPADHRRLIGLAIPRKTTTALFSRADVVVRQPTDPRPEP